MTEYAMLGSTASRARGIAGRLWDWLWPDLDAEGDGFRAEEDARAVLALRLAAGAAAVFAVTFNLLVRAAGDPRPVAIDLLAAAVSAVAFAASFHPLGRQHARGIAVFVGWLLGAFMISDLSRPAGHHAGQNGGLIIIMLVTAGIMPLRPASGIGFSLVLTAMYLVGGLWLDPGVSWPPPYSFGQPLASLTGTSFLAGVLLVAIRSLRVREYRSRQALSESLAELERTQAQLIAAEKAATQSRLAAALSHELNTPLGVLSSNVELVDRTLEGIEAGEESAEAARAARRKASKLREVSKLSIESSRRISDLVRRIQRFTGLDAAPRREVDINRLLEDSLELVLSEKDASGLQVLKELEPLPTLVVDQQGIGEVFASVLRNAVRAAGGSGKLRIRTWSEDNRVHVAIADDGPGIPADQLAHLFEPAFRPSAGRIGAGWGLPVARQIVSGHGGEIAVSSELGAGTEVTIELPRGGGEGGGGGNA